MHAPSVQFKGTGWYVTDYGGKDKTEKSKAEGSSNQSRSEKQESSAKEDGTSRKTRTATQKNQNPRSLKARSPKTESSWRLDPILLSKTKGRKQAHSSMLACGLTFAFSARALYRSALLPRATHGKRHLPFRHIRIHHHMVAVQDFAFQDLQRHRVLDQPLDRPLQRTRAISRS